MKERLVSLDAFRGATIAAMILVNNAGDWSHVHRQLEHAAWDGCTLTDLIFPFFVFIMGCAIPLAFAKRKPDDSVAWPILRRTALLYGFGLLLAATPFTTPPLPLRIPGVLQRIALCYLVAAPLSLRLGWRSLLALALALLVGYGLALELGGDLSPAGNLGARLDRVIFGSHLYRPSPWNGQGDPEGLLSTVPAVATALSGVLAGRWITDASRTSHERANGLFVAGVVCIAIGFAWNSWQPINKSLWSSSYVFFTTGLALQALGACYWLIDIEKMHLGTGPLLAFGRNAIFVYVASSALARVLVYGIKLERAGKMVALKSILYARVFPTSSEHTSMLWALGYVTIWWVVVALLDRKKIYFKV